MSPLLQCPCCDFFSLQRRGAHEICPICYWEDDGQDMDELDRISASNHISLRQARGNFERTGAADESATHLVAPEAVRARYGREKRATLH